MVRHEIGHGLPPALAFGGGGNRGPLGFALDLGVGKQPPRFFKQEDRVVVHAVRFEGGLKLRPYGIVAPGRVYSASAPRWTDMTKAFLIRRAAPWRPASARDSGGAPPGAGRRAPTRSCPRRCRAPAAARLGRLLGSRRSRARSSWA